MKQRGTAFKVTAIAIAVLFIGGFVAYRAGAFHWLFGGNDDLRVEMVSPDGTRTMSGSKSTFMFIPPKGSTPEELEAVKKELILMGGSKSISIGPIISPPPATKETPPAPLKTTSPPKQ